MILSEAIWTGLGIGMYLLPIGTGHLRGHNACGNSNNCLLYTSDAADD